MAAPRSTGGRKPTGQVIERQAQDGTTTYSLRFRAYGIRRRMTLGTASEGWTRERAEDELSNIVADVRRGIWQEPDAARVVSPRMPTFRQYADAWMQMREPELRDTTAERNGHSLAHLLPVFGSMRLDAISAADVSAYKSDKLAEGKLGADSINKTLKLLAQILDHAVEDDELITRNVAKGKRRRLKTDAPRRTWLESADQISALLDAADSVGRRTPWPGYDRAALATLTFAGLRIGELMDLRRKDVDLPSGRIRVGRSKTEAGLRDVNLLPVLRDELLAYLAGRDLGPDAYVFGTKAGNRGSESNLRNRLLKPAVIAANIALVEKERTPMSERVTPHSLRRTFASVLVAIGEDPAYVMNQLGHTDPSFTLKVYAQLMTGRNGERERIRALVNGEDWATMGQNVESGSTTAVTADRMESRITAPRAA